MTNQTKICVTKRFHAHSGRQSKGKTEARTRGKRPKRKVIKAAGISLILTLAATFTSGCGRAGKRVSKCRSEAPGAHIALQHTTLLGLCDVITGGGRSIPEQK